MTSEEIRAQLQGTQILIVPYCHPELRTTIETAWDDLDDAPEVGYCRVEGWRVEAFT